MIVIINSYNRLPMLKKVVSAWLKSGAEVHIMDDGSDFEPLDGVTWHSFKHKGKRNYWQIWDYTLRMLRNMPQHEMIVFTPDDFTKPNIKRIISQHERLKRNPYAFNIINDGRVMCWNNFMPRVIDPQLLEVGFVDCGFFCNRLALDTLGYYISEPPTNWTDNHQSSGVGYQITNRMMRKGVSMLLPTKSLATHGTHESKMHPEERKINPLQSQ